MVKIWLHISSRSSPVVFVCWITLPQEWLFSFSGTKRFSPVKKIRCSVVLKAHSPLLWLCPLASAPSNGAQLPGAINEDQAKCHCRRIGNVQRTGRDMQRTMCKEWNGSRSLFLAGFYSLVSFFPLTLGVFFRVLLLWGWDAIPQTSRLTAFIVGLYLLILGPALSSTLPSAAPSLWASSPLQVGNIHPLAASFASTFSFYSGPPRKSTPALEYFEVLVSSASIVQYFCFLGVRGVYSLLLWIRDPAGKGEKTWLGAG